MEKSTEVQFSEHVYAYYTMLCNAFRDGDDYCTLATPLKLNGIEIFNELSAMIMALKVFWDTVAPDVFEGEDILGFTHIINRSIVNKSISDIEAKYENGTDGADI